MPKKRKQKVRFRKGDKKPGNYNMKLTYRKKMVKRGKKILWQVVEYHSKSIIAEKFFEEDARKLMQFHNKHQVWAPNGGVVSFLCVKYGGHKVYQK